MLMLNPKASGLACGTICGAGFALFAIIAMFFDPYGQTAISFLSSVYLGYRPTIPGALIGGIWGFAEGALGGYAFAWLYNTFLHSGEHRS